MFKWLFMFVESASQIDFILYEGFKTTTEFVHGEQNGVQLFSQTD